MRTKGRDIATDPASSKGEEENTETTLHTSVGTSDKVDRSLQSAHYPRLIKE